LYVGKHSQGLGAAGSWEISRKTNETIRRHNLEGLKINTNTLIVVALYVHIEIRGFSEQLDSHDGLPSVGLVREIVDIAVLTYVIKRATTSKARIK
jgi:hypothetical protein